MGDATANSRRPWNLVRYHRRALIRLTVFASARASLQYTPFGILKYMVGGFRAAQPEFGGGGSWNRQVCSDRPW